MDLVQAVEESFVESALSGGMQQADRRAGKHADAEGNDPGVQHRLEIGRKTIDVAEKDGSARLGRLEGGAQLFGRMRPAAVEGQKRAAAVQAVAMNPPGQGGSHISR